MTKTDPIHPSEFLDIASMILPKSWKEILDMSTSFYLKNGTYQQVAKRIVRHFITEVTYDQDSDDERNDLADFLRDDFALNIKAGQVGDDFLAYGHSASTLVMPFDRFLRCKMSRCRAQTHIKNTSWNWNGDFHAHCPSCGNYGKHELIDRPSKDRKRINLFRISPYQLLVRKHPLSGTLEVRWDIDPDIKQKVRAGDKFTIEHMPFAVLEAIHNDAYLLFDPSQVHYYAEETLSGIDMGGLGLPRLLSSFSNVYYTHMLRRANEGLAHNHIVPLRLLSPGNNVQPASGHGRSNGLSLLSNNSPADINGHMQRIIQAHRADPTAWHYAPFPMNYQSMSGNAQLLTPGLLENGMREMMASMGFPMDLHYGTMEVQAAPMAIRLMEQCWGDMVYFLNSFAKFTVGGITRYMDWTVPNTVRYRQTTLANDLERKHVLAQMASGGMVSQDTMFRSWGLDRRDERQKMTDEMLEDTKAQEEFQKMMESRAAMSGAITTPAGAGMAPAGTPGAVGPGGAQQMGAPVMGAAGQSPQDIMAEADGIAQQLLQMPETERKRELSNISSNELLHAAVTKQLKTQRYDLGVEGRNMILNGGGG